MKDEDFISVYENGFSDDLCDRLIARHKELEEHSSSACRGETRNGGVLVRKDVSFYFQIDDPDLASEVNVALDTCLKHYLDQYPSLNMQSSFYSNIVKVQRTGPKGGFHKWHCEQGTLLNSTRLLVWMVYLNDTAEGEGTTEFIEQGTILQPKKGNVVFFPAGWTHTHRGNPVYSGDKYIATGWYYKSDE